MLVRLLFLAVAAICATAQTNRPDVRALVEMTGGMESLTELFKPETIETQMRGVLKPENAAPAQRVKVERFIAEFTKEFSAEANKRRPEILELIVEVTAKYYTPEDVEALMAFYKTPAGKKLLAVGPKAAVESMQVGSKWGSQLGEQIGKRVGQRLEAEDAQSKKP